MISTRRPNEYEVIGVRRFHEMRPGDMFKALITDIRPGEVTIRFNDGTSYTARSMVLPDARIGEDNIFLVKENDLNGRIVLEMVKLAPQTKQENMLNEALHNAGLSATQENFAMGQAMLAAGLPVDATTLKNNALHRLWQNPGALLQASPEEIQEVSRFLARTSSRRKYYRVNRYAELHVFKETANTTAILAVNAPALGRIEVTISQAPGYPMALTYRSETQETFDLLSARAPKDAHARLAAPFTLLTPPPMADPTPTRFNFDIRV
ncbi:MAG: hypothetical protein FWB88_06870 [Defluviitaleaceae bacterium]|nr:hypothetical protein [Defluviitaleaceae bacterium]MCL2239399.1 hypothetical protein [Defluviitaleaceae bacterium]